VAAAGPVVAWPARLLWDLLARLDLTPDLAIGILGRVHVHIRVAVHDRLDGSGEIAPLDPRRGAGRRLRIDIGACDRPGNGPAGCGARALPAAAAEKDDDPTVGAGFTEVDVGRRDATARPGECQPIRDRLRAGDRPLELPASLVCTGGTCSEPVSEAVTLVCMLAASAQRSLVAPASKIARVAVSMERFMPLATRISVSTSFCLAHRVLSTRPLCRYDRASDPASLSTPRDDRSRGDPGTCTYKQT
jgi:hypothetical protein